MEYYSCVLLLLLLFTIARYILPLNCTTLTTELMVTKNWISFQTSFVNTYDAIILLMIWWDISSSLSPITSVSVFCFWTVNFHGLYQFCALWFRPWVCQLIEISNNHLAQTTIRKYCSSRKHAPTAKITEHKIGKSQVNWWVPRRSDGRGRKVHATSYWRRCAISAPWNSLDIWNQKRLIVLKTKR